MSTPQEVKLALELALHLASCVNMFEQESHELIALADQIKTVLTVGNPKKKQKRPANLVNAYGRVKPPLEQKEKHDKFKQKNRDSKTALCKGFKSHARYYQRRA